MTPFVASITYLLSLATLVADIAIVLFCIWLSLWYWWWRVKGSRGEAGRAEPFRPLLAWMSRNAVGLGLVVSVAAVAGSLFFSNVAGFAPCELCWWQRVFIYPQVIIFLLAFIYEWRGKSLGPVFSISGVLSSASFLVGLYQYYGATFNANALAGCAATGVSCAKTYFTEFGFVTIPVMAITAAALLLTIVLARRYK